MYWCFDVFWVWFDVELGLRCVVFMGKGRVFCVGVDLKEWYEVNKKGVVGIEVVKDIEKWMDNGFGGMSNRRGKKLIIVVISGLCLGGGFEIVINCDMIIVSEVVKFGFLEVMCGVVVIVGVLF